MRRSATTPLAVHALATGCADFGWQQTTKRVHTLLMRLRAIARNLRDECCLGLLGRASCETNHRRSQRSQMRTSSGRVFTTRCTGHDGAIRSKRDIKGSYQQTFLDEQEGGLTNMQRKGVVDVGMEERVKSEQDKGEGDALAIGCDWPCLVQLLTPRPNTRRSASSENITPF